MKKLNQNEMLKIQAGAKPPQAEIDAAKAALTSAASSTNCPEGQNEPIGPTI